MTNSKTTKRALVSSAFVVLMCVAMLIGTTFAWFTDTATSGVNKIQSGTLDMKVEYSLDGKTWNELQNNTDLFGNDKDLFEPGYTRVVAFRISNVGNLAFNYRMKMNIESETKGVNKAGEEFKLSDYLKVNVLNEPQAAGYIGDIVLGKAFGSRVYGSGMTEHNFEDVLYDTSLAGNQFEILPGSDPHLVVMQVYMPTTVGNEANAISEDKEPSIKFGVSFEAKQKTYENDSYGNKYDEKAEYPTETTTVAP